MCIVDDYVYFEFVVCVVWKCVIGFEVDCFDVFVGVLVVGDMVYVCFLCWLWCGLCVF